MTLQVRDGGYYKTRGGRKVGPLRSDNSFPQSAFIEVECDGRGWSLSGRAIGAEHGSDEDLIAEWTDGPVRTVTRTVTEIVPGVWSLLEVTPDGTKRVNVALTRQAPATRFTSMTPAELRAAAAVLLELAGALDSE